MILAATTDKFQLVTSAAATLDVHVSFVDASNTTLAPSGAGKQNTAITTATATDILAAPAASTVRTVLVMKVRNKHATLATDVTIVFDQNGTDFELYKTTLLAGETLEWTPALGFFTIKSARLDRWLRVTGADYVNATTSFTDIMTVPVLNGKQYNFEAHLIHAENATTTGPRFGINGPTLSAILISILDVVVIGVDTTTMRSGSVTAVDTSAAGASLSGKTANALAIMSGVFTAGADGTFAIRGQSEVAVAAGLTVRIGSWCHVWEATG